MECNGTLQNMSVTGSYHVHNNSDSTSVNPWYENVAKNGIKSSGNSFLTLPTVSVYSILTHCNLIVL